MRFTKNPVRLGSGRYFHGVCEGKDISLVYATSDGTIKLKNITKSDNGYQTSKTITKLAGNEAVLVGEKIVAIDGKVVVIVTDK